METVRMTTEFTATAHKGVISIPKSLPQWREGTFRIILVKEERTTAPRHERVLGLHKGVARIRPDFDDPLPETFLLDGKL